MPRSVCSTSNQDPQNCDHRSESEQRLEVRGQRSATSAVSTICDNPQLDSQQKLQAPETVSAVRKAPRVVREAARMARESSRLTGEEYRITREEYRITRELNRITREVSYLPAALDLKFLLTNRRRSLNCHGVSPFARKTSGRVSDFLTLVDQGNPMDRRYRFLRI